MHRSLDRSLSTLAIPSHMLFLSDHIDGLYSATRFRILIEEGLTGLQRFRARDNTNIAETQAEVLDITLACIIHSSAIGSDTVGTAFMQA